MYPISTARLRLRPLTTVDSADLFAYRSLEEVCRFVPFEPMSVAVIEDKLNDGWSRRAIQSEGEALTLGIEHVESGHVIGDVMLFLRSAQHRCGEVGWVLHPSHAGRGLATEAAHALLHLGFDTFGLHRVVARVDARNVSSLRLCDRLGMRREAHLMENEWFKGGWSDEINFALLEEEWSHQHPTTQRTALTLESCTFSAAPRT